MQKSVFALAMIAFLTIGAGCSTAEPVATGDTGANDAAGGTQLADGEPGATGDVNPDLVGGDAAPGDTGVADDPEETEGSVKEFTVHGDNFTFDVSTMEVKKGDTVRVTFINDEGFHDWVIDEFNAATKQIQAGASETIEFVADKTGSFEYYCSVGQHRVNGMKGTLTVTE